jgi:phage terminase large subunit-like protein
MTREEKIQYIQLMEERIYRESRSAWLRWFPDEGPLRRELYAKHLDFFRNTNLDRDDICEVALIAGNRVGKTIAGAYCVKCWTTGVYPDWWEGRVFDGPTNGWCAGDTSETVRDIIQLELLGPRSDIGTGMIPADAIIRTTPRTGVPDAVKDIYVRHEPSNRTSYIGLKTYDQKRKSFQGTSKDWIWNDEEPGMDVYAEEILRLMTTKGVIINTFTPLSGLSDVVLSFLPGGKAPEV